MRAIYGVRLPRPAVPERAFQDRHHGAWPRACRWDPESGMAALGSGTLGGYPGSCGVRDRQEGSGRWRIWGADGMS